MYKEGEMTRAWKFFAATIAVMMIMALGAGVVTPSHVQAAGPWYIDGTNGTDNNTQGTGTGIYAFKTINYAIADVRVLAGDTVNVAAGTYIESNILVDSG